MLSSEIPKIAAEEADGLYSVRTDGLRHRRQHAELEITGVPRRAVEAASKLIDYVIDAVIDHEGAELQHGERVGIPLSIKDRDEIAPVFIGVCALESEPMAGGFFSRLLGRARSTFCLVDLVEPDAELLLPSYGLTPIAALSTLMLYRANCRLVTGDRDGALDELRASIELLPGDPAAGPPPREPDIDDVELNWQNYQSYLRLAELHDEPECDELYRQTFERFPWLAASKLGAPLAQLDQVDAEALSAEARRILAHNLENPLVGPGPDEALRLVGSPIWTPGEDGDSVRLASILPAAFVDYYYGERLAEPANAELVARVAAEAVALFSSRPWRLAWVIESARGLYGDVSDGAPVVDEPGPRHPAQELLSATIAEAARWLHAGATADLLRAVFGVAQLDDTSALEDTLDSIESWEDEQFLAAMSAAD
jgi:hypothetical protein